MNSNLSGAKLVLITLLVGLCLNTNAQKYTGTTGKSKFKIWIENTFGTGKRKNKNQEALQKALDQLEISRKKIEEAKNGYKPPVLIDNALVNPSENWTDEMLKEVNDVTERINKLIDETAVLSPFKPKDKKRLDEIEIELTKLITKKIIPFQKIELQLSNTKILASDYSFKTGSAELSIDAKNSIKGFTSEWENEILNWINYEDLEKIKVYKNEKIQIRINILGYADKQGKGTEDLRTEKNRKLSEKRSENVKNEIQDAISVIKTKYNVEIDYIWIGKGEELPKDVYDVDLINNPERRKVLVDAVIYPTSLLKRNAGG